MSADEGFDKISLEFLRYYVPIYQKASRIEEEFFDLDDPSREDVAMFENAVRLKNLCVERFVRAGRPLMQQELGKILSQSHLRTTPGVLDSMFLASVEGMKKGLRKFDVEKLNVSSTNYLFQWITTYGKKELLAQEAPNGIPPSRFQKMKKIAAVRKRHSEELGREASDQEIFEYFQSGRADLVTLNGRLRDRGKRSQANLQITLELIEEQREFEKNLFAPQLIDPDDRTNHLESLSTVDAVPFEQTVFGAFCKENSVRKDLVVVLKTELSYDLNTQETEILENMSSVEFKKLSKVWKMVVRDPNGPFYRFLVANKGEGFEEFDFTETIKLIDAVKSNSDVDYAEYLDERKSVMS